MQGLPKVFKTRADYEYIRSANIYGWQDQWKQLLESRFVVENNELVEDQNAPIFRLGFIVAEIESIVGFSGYTNREVEWYSSQPDRYQLVDGVWIENDGWAEAKHSAQMSDAVAAKVAEIEAESRRRQLADIAWDGHAWHADAWATKTIESCCAVATALSMADTDPIRVPYPLQNGYWLSADLDQSGNRVPIYMTVGEMRQLLAALYDRNGAIWGKEVIHKETIEAMVAEGSSSEVVAAYNYLLGWD